MTKRNHNPLARRRKGYPMVRKWPRSGRVTISQNTPYRRKSLIMRHAPCWNRTNNPVIKSHLEHSVRLTPESGTKPLADQSTSSSFSSGTRCRFPAWLGRRRASTFCFHSHPEFSHAKNKPNRPRIRTLQCPHCSHLGFSAQYRRLPRASLPSSDCEQFS